MNSASKPAFCRTAALASIFAVSVSAGHAHARCQSDTGVILGELNIDPAKISRTTFEIVYAGVTGMGVTGYSIWLQSDSCQGSVVVNFDTDCRVIGTFPRGNFSLQSLLK
jgi:hypothetical protein